jgi:hypothetical protein
MILKEVTEPTEGDYKVKTHYAWFPVWVDNKKIWLQRYQLFYEYKWGYYYPYGTGIKMRVLGWVQIDQKVLDKRCQPERHYH